MKTFLLIGFLFFNRILFAPPNNIPIINVKETQNLILDLEILRFKQKLILIEQRREWGYDERTQLKIIEISKALQIPEQWLYDIFFIECRHDHHLPNPYSNAIGLIQFVPFTALWLGTSTYELSTMNKYEQLHWVYMYLRYYQLKTFGKYNKKKSNLYNPLPIESYKSKEQLYLAIFYPAALNKDDLFKIGGKNVALTNKIFDLDNDGQIFKYEVFNFIKFKKMDFSKKRLKPVIGKVIQLTYTNQKNIKQEITGRILFCSLNNILFAYEGKEFLIQYNKVKKVESDANKSTLY